MGRHLQVKYLPLVYYYNSLNIILGPLWRAVFSAVPEVFLVPKYNDFSQRLVPLLLYCAPLKPGVETE